MTRAARIEPRNTAATSPLGTTPAPSPWKRCFLALAPTPETVLQLEALPIAAATARVATSDLHLTLAFLGAVTPEQGSRLCSALPSLAATPPHALSLQGLETWPSRATPHVQVAAFNKQTSLEELLARIHHLLRELALPIEARPFRPHVTLCRFPRRQPGTPDASTPRHPAQPGAPEPGPPLAHDANGTPSAASDVRPTPSTAPGTSAIIMQPPCRFDTLALYTSSQPAAPAHYRIIAAHRLYPCP